MKNESINPARLLLMATALSGALRETSRIWTFESAVLVPSGGSSVQFGLAFQGWNARYGTNPVGASSGFSMTQPISIIPQLVSFDSGWSNSSAA